MLNLKWMEAMVVLGTIANNMPELPEVETIKNTLEHLVCSKEIKSVDVYRAKNIDGDVDEFINSLVGRTIQSLSRVGKFLVFHFDENIVMISHLRMEGKYYLKNEGEPIGKHDLVVFHFMDDTFLTYNDTRRFGVLKIANEKNYTNEPPLSNVGPDPFMMNDAFRLEKAFKTKHIPIKQALLDQTIMSGLGNIYVDEVLFLCKIHPKTPANLITRRELDDVLTNSRIVLKEAIVAGGSTIKSYHPQQGISGNFQVQLQVYGKAGGKCPNCGHSFRKIFVNGRGTTYCPHCQKDVALPHVVAITGAIASGKGEVSSYLASKGYHYINADEIVHELYKDEKIQVGIKKIIPSLVVTNNEIDRLYLKNYLLDNPNKKARLEKYLYVIVSERIHDFIHSFKHNEKVVMEVPLLFQSKIDDLADEIYIVYSSKEIQMKRLQARNGNIDSYLKLNESYLKQENKKKATALICNNKDVASLHKLIDKLICGK
jgi:formamidopyrimidine-DNA glycosylase